MAEQPPTLMMNPEPYRVLQDDWLRDLGYGAFLHLPLLRGLLVHWATRTTLLAGDWTDLTDRPDILGFEMPKSSGPLRQFVVT